MPFRHEGKASYTSARYVQGLKEYLARPAGIVVEQSYYSTSASLPVAIANNPINSALALCIEGWGNDSMTAPSTLTWAGKTLARQVYYEGQYYTNRRISASIYLLLNPGAGSGSIAGISNSWYQFMAALLLSGVNQATPLFASGVSASSPGSISISSELYGLLVETGLAISSDAFTTGSPAGGQISVSSIMSYKAATEVSPGNMSRSYSMTGSNPVYGMSAISLKPA